MPARKDWRRGGQKVDCIGRNVGESTGEKTLMQYAGRQEETLLVKVVLHTHADDTQRGTLHPQRLPGKAALVS